jgi:hypothetical protein
MLASLRLSRSVLIYNYLILLVSVIIVTSDFLSLNDIYNLMSCLLFQASFQSCSATLNAFLSIFSKSLSRIFRHLCNFFGAYGHNNFI